MKFSISLASKKAKKAIGFLQSWRCLHVNHMTSTSNVKPLTVLMMQPRCFGAYISEQHLTVLHVDQLVPICPLESETHPVYWVLLSDRQMVTSISTVCHCGLLKCVWLPCNHSHTYIAMDTYLMDSDAQRLIPSSHSSSFVPPMVLDSEFNSTSSPPLKCPEFISFKKPCVLALSIVLFHTLCISINTSTRYAQFHSKNVFIHLVLCFHVPCNLCACIFCPYHISILSIVRYVWQTSDNVFSLVSWRAASSLAMKMSLSCLGMPFERYSMVFKLK